MESLIYFAVSSLANAITWAVALTMGFIVMAYFATALFNFIWSNFTGQGRL
jgi:hypothetical protein